MTICDVLMQMEEGDMFCIYSIDGTNLSFTFDDDTYEIDVSDTIIIDFDTFEDEGSYLGLFYNGFRVGSIENLTVEEDGKFRGDWK